MSSTLICIETIDNTRSSKKQSSTMHNHIDNYAYKALITPDPQTITVPHCIITVPLCIETNAAKHTNKLINILDTQKSITNGRAVAPSILRCGLAGPCAAHSRQPHATPLMGKGAVAAVGRRTGARASVRMRKGTPTYRICVVVVPTVATSSRSPSQSPRVAASSCTCRSHLVSSSGGAPRHGGMWSRDGRGAPRAAGVFHGWRAGRGRSRSVAGGIGVGRCSPRAYLPSVACRRRSSP